MTAPKSKKCPHGFIIACPTCHDICKPPRLTEAREAAREIRELADAYRPKLTEAQRRVWVICPHCGGTKIEPVSDDAEDTEAAEEPCSECGGEGTVDDIAEEPS